MNISVEALQRYREQYALIVTESNPQPIDDASLEEQNSAHLREYFAMLDSYNFFSCNESNKVSSDFLEPLQDGGNNQ